VYNAILAGAACAWVAATWPHFRDSATPSSIFALAVLALLANLAYSAGYVAEIPIRRTVAARRSLSRHAVLLLGTSLALLIENYWIADEMYQSVH
jgi:hypothetical protein